MKNPAKFIGRAAISIMGALFLEMLITFGQVTTIPLSDWHWMAVLFQICYFVAAIYVAMIWHEEEEWGDLK